MAGGAALALHLSVLALLVDGLGQDETVASALGFMSAVPVNYYLQHRYVFKSKSNLAHGFLIYIGVTLVTLGFSTTAFWALVDFTEMHYLAAQILTTTIVVALNFILNRTVTFRTAAS